VHLEPKNATLLLGRTRRENHRARAVAKEHAPAQQEKNGKKVNEKGKKNRRLSGY
jgi:hypothetical protein